MRAEGDHVALALTVTPKVELENMMPLLQPRHEGGELRQPMARESMHQYHGGPRLARGGDQPAGKGDAVIGREANRFELEAHVRGGRRSSGGIGPEGSDLGPHEQARTAHADKREVDTGGQAGRAADRAQDVADHSTCGVLG